MRLFTTVLSAFMLIGAAYSKEKASSEQRFNAFHAMAKGGPAITLKDKSFRSLTASPRDYSVAVLLTAMEARVGCHLCKEFQPEWNLVSKSWANGDRKGESRLILGTLDFADGRDVFVSLGLQTVPVLMLFPPTDGPHASASKEPLRYDFGSGPPTAEQIQAWLAQNLPGRPHPLVKRPINWTKWATTATIFVGVLTFALTAWPYVLPIVQNRNVWASISLISILLFTSGHMFNHIRKVPYVTGDGNGGISYFAGGFQTQYGLETQIVAAVYGFMTFCAICLANKVPRMTDAKAQGAAVLIWSVVLFLFYGFLLSVFRIKNGGYPFSLPPFF